MVPAHDFRAGGVGDHRADPALGRNHHLGLMDCFNCLSLWISIPLAFFVADGMLARLVAWLALSGAACLAEQLSTGQLAKPPVFFETVAKQDN